MSEAPFSTTRPLFGQVAIVTGASRGIGRATAIALAKAGASVVVNYVKSQESAESVVDDCRAHGSKALVVRADVTRLDHVRRMIEAATALGPPSILVNNAGLSYTGLFSETSPGTWDSIISTNLTAPFLCTREVLPYMMKAQYGRVINISSIWGLTGGSCEVAYSASKGGLISFTKALAKEVARFGITVNAVAPGAIETDMMAQLSAEDREEVISETPVGRFGEPDDVANSVLFLASPSSSFISGQVISPNGGLFT